MPLLIWRVCRVGLSDTKENRVLEGGFVCQDIRKNLGGGGKLIIKLIPNSTVCPLKYISNFLEFF